MTETTEYLENCLKTESTIDQAKPIDICVLSKSFQLSSDVGDLLDLIKKGTFYGKNITENQLLQACEKIELTLSDTRFEIRQSAEAAANFPESESGMVVTAVKKSVLHGMIGLITESGELASRGVRILSNDVIGDDDRVNIIEELGDACWYISIIINALATTWAAVFIKNIKKLAARFPGQVFSFDKANNRDLAAELVQLES